MRKRKYIKKLLIIIVLFSSILFAQDKRKHFLWADVTHYVFEAVTGTNIVTSTDAFIYGSYNRTKANSLTGSPRALPYMRWWQDSTESLLANGTFDRGIDSG